MANTNAPKQKRGGKTAGRGELEQGFYSTTFNQEEIKDLGEVDNTTIAHEIAMFRVQTRRLMEFSNSLQPNLESIISITRALGSCATHLASLLQTEGKLKEVDQDRTKAEVSRALAEVVEEFKL